LSAEVIGRRGFADLSDCQRRFDAWRVIYNRASSHPLYVDEKKRFC
jgi:hypothetical protein